MMKPDARWSGRMVLVLVTGCFTSGWRVDPIAADDAVPLHALIDQRITPVGGGQVPRCSDGEFLRRASLDLTGMPPTADQAREFLHDSAADKRARLIDGLLASPHYPRHLAATLDLMLMERRPHTHVTADQWQAWLLAAVRENKPWNVLVRELLLADGTDSVTRPAARFLLDRAVEPHLLTRDIGRILFGRDLQCAQCHDHPAVADYLQADYHGLLAFVSTCYPQVIKTGDQEQTVVGEKAGQALAFESVFERVPHRTGARMPDAVAIEEPFLLPGEEYEVAPADNTKPVPKFSRRERLAELATAGTNQAFNENIANRLWAHMFGRGLVHPLDLHHADNPATEPELLALLAERFAAMNFDIRAFLRELALTEAYGRSFDPPLDPLAWAEQAREEITNLSAELAAAEARADQSAGVSATALETWYAAEAAAIPVATEVDTARRAYAEAKQQLDQANAAVAVANGNLQAKSQAAAALQQAVTALQAAQQAIPEDPEIAQAAQQLLVKSEQATAAAAELAVAAEAATAALEAPTKALAEARPLLDAAQAKLTPLAAAVTAAEQQLLRDRRAAAEDAERVAALRRRLETATMIASLPAEQQAIAEATQLVGLQTDPSTAAPSDADADARQATLDQSLASLTERWARDFTVSALRPLTPEQLCWSVFRVTGVYQNYWNVEAAELDKTNPLSTEQLQDAALVAARHIELEQRTYDKLKANESVFVSYFGAAAGQPQGDFFATADQALFAANGGSLNAWVVPAGDNVTQRIVQATDPALAAEELYLALLTRLPTAEETAEVTAYLAGREADRVVAAQELVWALLNSAEFRFNH